MEWWYLQVWLTTINKSLLVFSTLRYKGDGKCVLLFFDCLTVYWLHNCTHTSWKNVSSVFVQYIYVVYIKWSFCILSNHIFYLFKCQLYYTQGLRQRRHKERDLLLDWLSQIEWASNLLEGPWLLFSQKCITGKASALLRVFEKYLFSCIG